MKNTTFRKWIQQIWYEHCTEYEAWFKQQPVYSSKEYFHSWKWWLRQEYRRRKRNGDIT